MVFTEMSTTEMSAAETSTAEMSAIEMSATEMSTAELLLPGNSDNILNMCTIVLKFRIGSENKKSIRNFILGLSTFFLTLSNLSKHKKNSFKY